MTYGNFSIICLTNIFSQNKFNHELREELQDKFNHELREELQDKSLIIGRVNLTFYLFYHFMHFANILLLCNMFTIQLRFVFIQF